MKKYLKLIPVILFFSCEKSINNYAIVIHGGAGTVIRENTSKELQKKYEDKLREAPRSWTFYFRKWRQQR